MLLNIVRLNFASEEFSVGILTHLGMATRGKAI